MIQINLLPGSAKRQKQRLPSLAAATGGSRMRMPQFDRPMAVLVGLWVVGLGLTAFLHFGSAAKLDKLAVDVQAAQRDSARLQNLRQLNDSIQRQIDNIGTRLSILQEIDAGRYTWSHILDEVSRALPQYTWLVNVTGAAGESKQPRVRIEGRTGNTFALAKFMQDLEASAFLRNVVLLSQTQTTEKDKVVYAFVLEVTYQEPPADAIETQPLFTQTGDLLLDGDSASREGN